MVLILGFVAVTKMDTNLLPDVSTPYLMVVTVYPGASPERVESEVSDVLENALTVPGVSDITATSAENYSLLLMKFVDDTDMNSAMVKVSNKLDPAKNDLPSTCLTPSVIEYSLNMNAFMTVAVSREGADQYELSEFIQKTLVPELQRRGGVSSVSSSGLVDKMVQVQLNQDKINDINAKLLELIDTQLAAARGQLEAAEAQITAGRKEYEKQLKNFGNTVASYIEALKKIFVLEDSLAWNPNLRSKTAIRTSDTRYFSDPSIGVAALGIGPNDLVNDLSTMGLFFESMCIRDLRVYADAIDGTVYHYRDGNGLECDAVVHLRNGNYGLIEVKLGGEKNIEEGAKNLKLLASKIDDTKMKSPSFLMVLTGTSRYAVRRPDGVYVVPIGCLKD